MDFKLFIKRYFNGSKKNVMTGVDPGKFFITNLLRVSLIQL